METTSIRVRAGRDWVGASGGQIKTIDKSTHLVHGQFSTVADVSRALGSEHGFEPELQQLIFQGKMLKPDDPVPAIADNGFMVLTMRKNKPAPKPAPEPAAEPAVEPAAEPVPEPSAEVEASAEEQPVAPAAIPANPAAQAAEEPALPANPAAEEPAAEAVETLRAMGFDEEQARTALRLSRGNVEVAGALLLDPEMMLAAEQAGPAAEAPAGQLTEEQVVQMMEHNPQMLAELMQSLTAQDPQAAAMAQQNPQAFISFLTQVMNQAAGQGGPAAAQGAAQQAPLPGQVEIQVSAEEREALTGLEAMFPHIPKMAVLQTFKACGSDSAVAANLLFDYQE